MTGALLGIAVAALTPLPGPALPLPSSEGWAVELGALGGADLEAGAVFPASETFGFGVARFYPGETLATVAGGGDVLFGLDEGLWISDYLSLDATLARRGGRLGGAVSVQGSLASGAWAEVAAAARWSTFELPTRLRAEARVGLAGRWDDLRGAPGLLATGFADARLGARLRVGARAELRSFIGDAPGLSGLSATLRWSPSAQVSARLEAGLWSSWREELAAWADQASPGVPISSTLVGIDARLPQGWSLPVEAGVQREIGASSSIWLLRAGVVKRLESPPRSALPQEVQLRVLSPAAGVVEVLGSFTGWEPQPMSRQEDGSWVLNVTLPPGVHTYVYRVDGQLSTPEDAHLTREDEFGVRQGLLLVGR